jgi:hypothetical protein
MGILQNLFKVLSGKQRNHIYHDEGGAWGFATSKNINISESRQMLRSLWFLKGFSKKDVIMF